MKDFLKRLSSRKFLATAATAALLFYAKQYELGVATILGWILTEGSVDAVGSFQAGKQAIEKVKSDVHLIENDRAPVYGTIPGASSRGVDDTDRIIQPGQ